jgi:hypothetical protein
VLADLKEEHRLVEPPEVLEERQELVMGTMVQHHSGEMASLVQMEYLALQAQPLQQHLEQDIICLHMEQMACQDAALMAAAVEEEQVKIIMVAMEAAAAAAAAVVAAAVVVLHPEPEAAARLFPFLLLILWEMLRIVNLLLGLPELAEMAETEEREE